MGAILLPVQVAGAECALLTNSKSNYFDCYLHIHEGQAVTIRERVQVNGQYSVVVPTEADVAVAHSHMPLQYNLDFQGSEAIEWDITSHIHALDARMNFDFYGITPHLAPAVFYNKAQKGDLVKVFSHQVEGERIDRRKVGLFDNETDSKSWEKSMFNGGFSNGFIMGAYAQLYNGSKINSQEEANYTSLDHEE